MPRQTVEVFKLEITPLTNDSYGEIVYALRRAANQLEAGRFPEWLWNNNDVSIGHSKMITRREI